MYHNFFTHSSVNGHLGCFHVLTIANSAAMNNGIHVSLSILVQFPQGICLGVGLLGHMVVLFLLFKESLYCSLGEGNGTPLQYSCLENPMDRGAW